ncbi:MAG: hypothetical protein V1798_12255 [Pseudomonadota bacterium]
MKSALRIIRFLVPLALLASPVWATTYVVSPEIRNDDDLKGVADKASQTALSANNITDVGMRVLEQFTSLKTLTITSRQVTDQGLEHLEPLKQLTDLSLVNTQVTGKGFKSLKEWGELRQLRLDGSPIRDEAFQWISVYPKLETLSLRGTFVTGAGLKALKSLRGLKELNLSDTDISDGKTASLADLGDLTSLDLSKTKLTDASVADLQKLKKLDNLSVTDTSITLEGYRSLRIALPFTTIRPPVMRMVSPNSPEDLWWNVAGRCLSSSTDGRMREEVLAGGESLVAKKYRQAVETYKKAVSQSKSDQGRCWFVEAAVESLLANAHRQAGDLKEAEAGYKDVLGKLTSGPYGDKFPAANLVKQILDSLSRAKNENPSSR